MCLNTGELPTETSRTRFRRRRGHNHAARPSIELSVDMSEPRARVWRWLIAIVIAHLVISFLHGNAHAQARVLLSPVQNVFVYAVILAGPLLGLALAWWSGVAGSRLIAVTMAGALVFGVVNHFVLSSPDRVSHVDPAWRLLFGTTAALLAVTEALAVVLALRLARKEN
jgi:hypothetical protein